MWGPLAAGSARAGAFFLACARAERHRWALWLPVMLGSGAALYFALPDEPSLGAAIVAGLIFLVAALAGLLSHRGRMAAALVAALALGFCAAKLREVQVAAPVLDHPMTLHLTARVRAVDPAPGGARLVLDRLRSGAFLPGDIPARARVAVRGAGALPQAGDGVSLTARLMAPPGPAAPGDDDFARAAFFQRIGAVGFAYGRPLPAPPAAQPGWRPRLAAARERLRAAITTRIRRVLPGPEGAVATALVTGARGGIEDMDQADLRDAGLAHVLAIAGLHMALVGLGLFWLARAILAAFPSLALRYPIKKWSALMALAGAGFYLSVSGATASATRAFVMLAMMLLAILLDRPALSMRSLALAAALLLLARPESITEPGFQMSFAAVTALVAVAEWEQGRARDGARRPAWLRYLRAIALTSLVGSLATLPFAVFYFDRATHYAVLGNLLAMPVMGFVVMPAAAAGVIAMPLGLEQAPLLAMGLGIRAMLAIGHFVSGLPGAVTALPSFPVTALAAMGLGGLWLALWQRGWRWLGLLPLGLGLVLALTAPAPDMLVASDGRSVAVRGPDGLLHFLRRPKDRFAANRWLARDGDSRPLADVLNAAPPDDMRCDGLGCVTRLSDGQHLAVALRPEALADDCQMAQIVIASVPAPACRGPRLVLDGPALTRGGGYALFLPDKAVSIRDARGDRPWAR